MDATNEHEWVGLHDFEDPALARDVITSILSMEFDALLVDLSNDSVVAGGTPSSSSTGWSRSSSSSTGIADGASIQNQPER